MFYDMIPILQLIICGIHIHLHRCTRGPLIDLIERYLNILRVYNSKKLVKDLEKILLDVLLQ